MELRSGAIVACEVLARPADGSTFARWRESAPLSARAVWGLALAAARPFLAGGLDAHVNLGAGLLATSGFGDDLAAQLPPDELARLVIEVTEVEPIVTSAGLQANLASLRRRGVTIALDDFGEGYSNFDALGVLRPEVVKITRATAEGGAVDIAAWFVRTCGVLGVRHTVVECVESPAQRDWAVRAGFELGQGYLWTDRGQRDGGVTVPG